MYQVPPPGPASHGRGSQNRASARYRLLVRLVVLDVHGTASLMLESIRYLVIIAHLSRVFQFQLFIYFIPYRSIYFMFYFHATYRIPHPTHSPIPFLSFFFCSWPLPSLPPPFPPSPSPAQPSKASTQPFLCSCALAAPRNRHPRPSQAIPSHLPGRTHVPGRSPP